MKTLWFVAVKRAGRDVDLDDDSTTAGRVTSPLYIGATAWPPTRSQWNCWRGRGRRDGADWLAPLSAPSACIDCSCRFTTSRGAEGRPRRGLTREPPIHIRPPTRALGFVSALLRACREELCRARSPNYDSGSGSYGTSCRRPASRLPGQQLLGRFNFTAGYNIKYFNRFCDI